MDKINIFSLFTGRHPLPENKGAICSDFDFDRFRAVRSSLWSEALHKLKDGQEVRLIVTGLTPALTEFLSEAFKENASGKLILLHYNSSTQQYVEQEVL